MADEIDTETETDVDLDEALKEVSDGLFDTGEGEEKSSPSVEEGPDVAEVAPAEAAPAPNSPEVQAVGAPSTWTKEAIAEWATIPERAKQEILKREEDITKGIESYRSRAEAGDIYNSIIEPYRPMLEAEQVDPAQILRGFATNHYILLKGSPEQKLQLAQNLMVAYGIDPVEVALGLAGRQQQQADPKLKPILDELAQLRNTVAIREQQISKAEYNTALSNVQAFANDPNNIYYSEVEDDILHLMESGAVSTLEDAYAMAVLRNPVTREKEVARLAAEKNPSPQPTKDKTKPALAANVNSTQAERDGTVPLGTMDETLAETFREISNRG